MSQRKLIMFCQPAKFRAQLLRISLLSLFVIYALFATAGQVALRATAAPGEAALDARANSTTAPVDGPDPCASLTPAAIQHVIDVIAQSRAKAESDVAANGETGAYASAARDNLAYLVEAHNKMVALQNWLKDAGIDSPYVTNASGAYNIHGYVREIVTSLHYARHWAIISASYHSSVDARDSYELTTQALNLVEALGSQAGRCYMNQYLP
jgi:hypothetical protein